MTVYAIPVTAIHASSVRSSATCYQTVQTVLNQGTFHILDMAPGDYYVLASTVSAVIVPASESRGFPSQAVFGGAYTKAVPCGLEYTCTDHSLIPVTLHGGQTTPVVEVTDWYVEPGVFPSLPANAPRPISLAPAPAGFSSAQEAARYYAQVALGGVYTESACPVNRACLSVGAEHDGVASAYFVGTAGSNADLRSCAYYVYQDSAGWHNVNVLCSGGSPVFPSVGATGTVSGGLGDTECVHVRATPGRTGAVAGCLALGTTVAIDQGPVFVADSDPSLSAVDHLWWHLKGHGWMVHRYLGYG
jgi:hypothetical protein